MTLTANVEQYRRHVERFAMSDDQKTELLRAVWHIMESFVDRAFGIDSVQLTGSSAKRAERVSHVIDSKSVVETSSSPRDAFQASAGQGWAERDTDA